METGIVGYLHFVAAIRRPFGRRLSACLLSFFFFGTCALAEPASGSDSLQKDLSSWAAKVDQHRSRLKNSRAGVEHLTVLDGYLGLMKSCLERQAELAGELEAHDIRLRNLKMLEVEPKQRELDQIRQAAESRTSQLLFEKASLQTEIDRYNSQPLIFADRQLAAPSSYKAERMALEARRQRLMDAASLLQSELQPRFENASRAAAKVQQDFSAAVSQRDKTAQLLQEQAVHYANVRSLLADQLDILDHESSAARRPLP